MFFQFCSIVQGVTTVPSLVFMGSLRGESSHRSFIEKTSVKQSMKHKMCSNFQMSFLHLSQMDSPVEASSGQEWY